MSDRDDLERMEGLYVGLLSDDELRIFERAIDDGIAFRDYNSPAGFFCALAKVGLRRELARGRR